MVGETQQIPTQGPVMANLVMLNLPPFDAGTDRWSLYKTRLVYYFTCRKIIKDEERKAIFLASISLPTIELLQSLLMPKQLSDEEVTFDKIVDELDKQYDDAKSALPSVYSFYTCFQKPGQPISDWFTELKERARQCNFSASKWNGKPLERALRDMLVIGTNNRQIRERLIKEDDPDLDTSLKLAKAVETLQKDVADFEKKIRQEHSQESPLDNRCFKCNRLAAESTPIYKLRTNGRDIEYEIDTGAEQSLISTVEWVKIGRPSYEPTDIKLTVYDGRQLPVKDIFSKELGHCTKLKAKIHMKPEATPRFFKPRQVPFALLPAVKEELLHEARVGIIEKMIPQNGQLLLCLCQNQMEKFVFVVTSSKLDFKDTFLQIELDEEILQCSSHLPEGYGSTHQWHSQLRTPKHPQASLERVRQFGFTCNREKCQFFQDQVHYLGYIISKNGKIPHEERVKAIKNFPTPKNVKDVESFLGKLNYYGSFIPDMSTICEPLNMLRRKETKFKWTEICNAAFDKLKLSLAEATMLVHYDPAVPLVLATDASEYGIGAVLLHQYPDKTERPIAHASKTLNPAERGYSQIEKKGLAIVYGVKKFHQYLAARKFILFTDHQPLVSIFHPAKCIPVYTLKRLQRWALTLMSYSFEIIYKPTKKHTNADALSRLPAGPDPTFQDEDSIKLNRINCDYVTRFL
uniref:Reverse transcriptase/retrotransposon-derived protein RNase H-like domain-containing protein n=1 Tax=Acrobeloides nanus TaxID=290746 RepID=A0A914CIU4_9BILA